MSSIGQIYKIHSDFYYVNYNNKIFECKLREVLKKQHLKVVTGDFVHFENGAIEDILPRKSYISHPDCANVEQIIIVSAIKEPDLDFVQLNRYIAFSEYYNIPIKLCFNKNDLSLDDKIIDKVFSIYEPLGYDIIFTSAIEQEGTDDFKNLLTGKISVLAGGSGVGKSSLINAINPDINLRTGNVSDKSKRGTHTTRHCEIISLDINSKIVDTPGFSNLKFDFLMPNEVGKLFNEIKPLEQYCKFSDCLHIHESGCAILENIENIDATRYKSYIAFVNEAKEYKEHVKYNGTKSETRFKQSSNKKRTVKISHKKRESARNTLKQNIQQHYDKEQ